ncbi:MAG: hypothetical protein Ct9H300mP16_17620 [Pseudomonadota bacterium]|nr:MAG: hypothetical protein Ct9H300mP16_17620 [Pseudomonadota bacterium]
MLVVTLRPGHENPRSGFDRDTLALRIVMRTDNVSPGRTGLGQFSFSIPEEPRLDSSDRKLSAISRIIMPRCANR